MSNNTSRIDDIATRLHTACGVIADPTREANDLNDKKNDILAGMNGVSGTRLTVAAAVAAMAHAEAWTDAEVVQAIGKAVKMSNNNDGATKTMNVFLSEMKQFASPKVRATFPTTLAALQAAWLAEQDMLAGLEGDERKEAYTPIKKFKPRIYHLVIEAARRIKDGKLTPPTCIDDVVAWAEDNDPSHDEKKVAKLLAATIAKMESMLSEFGLDRVPDVVVATDFLKTLKADELLAARTKMLAEAEAAAEAVANKDSSVSGEYPAQPAVAGGGELITGAFDYQSEAIDRLEKLTSLAA